LSTQFQAARIISTYYIVILALALILHELTPEHEARDSRDGPRDVESRRPIRLRPFCRKHAENALTFHYRPVRARDRPIRRPSAWFRDRRRHGCRRRTRRGVHGVPRIKTPGMLVHRGRFVKHQQSRGVSPAHTGRGRTVYLPCPYSPPGGSAVMRNRLALRRRSRLPNSDRRAGGADWRIPAHHPLAIRLILP